MIALASDCLLFETDAGEFIPYSADMISIDVKADSGQWWEPEHVQEAAKAVFYYFKHHQGRQCITLGEFAEALEKVMHDLGLVSEPLAGDKVSDKVGDKVGVVESDLHLLAKESGHGCELFFFPLLRDELRQQIRKCPRMLRFRGLRLCVKRLTGARRWSSRCRHLQQQIVGYLRECLNAEKGSGGLALVVD